MEEFGRIDVVWEARLEGGRVLSKSGELTGINPTALFFDTLF